MNQVLPSAIDAFIGLGSNLDDPIKQIVNARTAISALAHVDQIAFSPLYSSQPVGPQDQPDFINAVMQIKTTLTADELLTQLQNIENQQGRVRLQRWGARTLDLDILLFGNQRIDTPRLSVPHPEMARRSFVLYPLLDISDQALLISGLGRLGDLIAACPPTGLQRIDA